MIGERIVLALSLLALGAVSCSAGGGEDPLAPPSPQPSSTSAQASTTSLQARYDRPSEREFRRLGDAVPAFGGMYLDGTDLVVFLTDLDASQAMTEALDAGSFRSNLHLGIRQPESSLRIVYQKGDYSFIELAVWRDRISERIFGLDGLVSIDLDDVRNRIVLGVGPGSNLLGSLRSIMHDAGIPEQAVIIETEEPVRLGSHESLRDYKRPVRGGQQIDGNLASQCTLGFNVTRSSSNYWVTAAHCSSETFDTDGERQHQPVFLSSEINYIGTEVYDRSPWYECPGGYTSPSCRWSDAALYSRSGSVSYGFGTIYRTACCGSSNGRGAILIDDANPYFLITAEVSAPSMVGQILDKMGKTSGWTYGQVTELCKDYKVNRLICQDVTDVWFEGGDSGSPVFIWEGQTVELIGIGWGILVGNRMVFSSMWNIEYDLEI